MDNNGYVTKCKMNTLNIFREGNAKSGPDS